MRAPHAFTCAIGQERLTSSPLYTIAAMTPSDQHYCPGSQTVIKNVECRNWNERQAKTLRLKALEQIARCLADSSSRQDAVRESLLHLEHTLTLRRCTVLLTADDGDELYVENSPSIQVNPAIRYRKGQGISNQVMATGESIILPASPTMRAF